MSSAHRELDHALRRSEQEAVAAIRAPTAAAARAHQALSLLHAMQVRTLLSFSAMTNPDPLAPARHASAS